MTGEHIAIVGAGIVGLATAHALIRRGHTVTVLEKEQRVAAHQTGRNSGVIHSGLYYRPGSLKAELGTAGAASMRVFAEERGIPVEICGKLVVATTPDQLPALHELHRRGTANGVPCALIDAGQAREYEPNVSCVAALRVESTGIVDYAAVSRRLVELIEAAGGTVRLGVTVTGIRATRAGVVVETDAARDEMVRADRLVNCAGLHSDRIAELAGLTPDVRIIPFRGSTTN